MRSNKPCVFCEHPRIWPLHHKYYFAHAQVWTWRFRTYTFGYKWKRRKEDSRLERSKFNLNNILEDNCGVVFTEKLWKRQRTRFNQRWYPGEDRAGKWD